MQTLKNLLEPYCDDFQIICYLREQVSMAESHYTTVLRAGWTGSFSEYMKGCSPENPYFNFDTLLTRWSNVFGESAIDVRIYEPGKLIDGDVVNDFFSVIGCDEIQVSRRRSRKNTSLLPIGQDLIRAFNILNDSESGLYEPIRNKFKQIVKDNFGGRSIILNYTERLEIQESFKISNECVRQKFFPKHENLFSNKQSLTTATQNNHDSNGLVEVMKLMFNFQPIRRKEKFKLLKSCISKLRKD